MHELIQVLQQKEIKLSFVIAGGGAGLFEIFKIPGCSKALTEARMLYSRESFQAFFGKSFEGHYVSQETANLMSTRMNVLSEADYCFALTSALSTDRERKGENRGFLAISRLEEVHFQLQVPVEGSTRELQDDFITNNVVKAVKDFISTL